LLALDDGICPWSGQGAAGLPGPVQPPLVFSRLRVHLAAAVGVFDDLLRVRRNLRVIVAGLGPLDRRVGVGEKTHHGFLDIRERVVDNVYSHLAAVIRLNSDAIRFVSVVEHAPDRSRANKAGSSAMTGTRPADEGRPSVGCNVRLRWALFIQMSYGVSPWPSTGKRGNNAESVCRRELRAGGLCCHVAVGPRRAHTRSRVGGGSP